MTNEEEIDCEEEPDHEECVCDGDDGDRAYDAWADDMVSFYFEHKMGLKKLVEKWLITLDEANGFDVYRAELEQVIVEKLTGDRSNWCGFGERTLDGMLSYEQYLKNKKESRKWKKPYTEIYKEGEELCKKFTETRLWHSDRYPNRTEQDKFMLRYHRWGDNHGERNDSR